MLKKTLFLLTLLQISFVIGQESSFREQMIKSGEAPPKVLSNQNGSFNQFLEFKKAKAWKSKAAQNSIFSNTADLDISNIGGRVRASLVDIDNGIALVAPSGGGLWKFTPKTGTPFTPLNDFGSFLAITDIAQNPKNKTEILIATGDEKHGTVGNGLFKSTDGGKTFKVISATSPITTNDFKFIRFVKYAPNNASTLYLSTGRKLFKSTNSGVSWNKVFEKRGTIHSIDFLNNDAIILSVDREGIYTSTTGNENSFSIINKLPNDNTARDKKLGGIVVAVSSGNRNVAYTAISKTLADGTSIFEVYKTSNGGTSWNAVGTPSFYRVAQTTFSLTIGVHPTNSNIVILGNIGWAYSTNSGTSWEVANGLEVDFHNIHFHASDPNVAYIGYDQGLGRVDFSKEQTFNSWDGTKYVPKVQVEQKEIGKTPGFNTSQIYYGDYFPKAYGDSYIQGQQDGGSFAIVNGKSRRIVVGDGGSAFVNKQDPTKAFSSAQRGWLTRSTNALEPTNFQTGKYTPIDGFYKDHPNFVTQFAGNNADGKQLYISKTNSIEMTINGGDSFNTLTTHALERVQVAVENAIDPVVYVFGYNRKTTPTGTTIIRIDKATSSATKLIYDQTVLGSVNESPNQIHIDPNDKNTVYITTSRGKAYKISNLDTTPIKTDIKGDIPNINFKTVIGLKSKPNVLIAGTDVGVFYSTDSGTTWSISNELPYTKVMDLKLRESDNRLFIFTHGRGAWASTINTDNAEDEDPEDEDPEDEDPADWNIYPIPSNKLIHIKPKEDLTFDEIIVYDQNGKKMITTSKKTLNITNLATGVYILHITSNNKIIHIQKIIIE